MCSVNMSTPTVCLNRSLKRKQSHDIRLKKRGTVQNHQAYQDPEKSQLEQGKRHQQTKTTTCLRIWNDLTRTIRL